MKGAVTQSIQSETDHQRVIVFCQNGLMKKYKNTKFIRTDM